MSFTQDQRLINMLLDMQRCGHLEQFASKGSDDVCRNTIYNPAAGYIPRAFEEAKCAPGMQTCHRQQRSNCSNRQ